MATGTGRLTTGAPPGAPAGATGPAPAPAPAAPAVEVHRLRRSFGPRVVLDGIDLTIPAGQFVALLGHSGSGKSTLLRALADLDHDVEGDGDLAVPERISVVFQDSRLLPWRRVLDNVLFGTRGADMADRGRAALAEVGLAGRERAWPRELSGGEAQRAALARSLVREPELLLADEPFGALDALTRIRMHALLRRLWVRHRPTVLLVTHDVDEAVVLADRVLVLDEGRFGVDLTVDVPHPRSYRDPRLGAYRDLLLGALGVGEDAFPDVAPGGIPSSDAPPAGAPARAVTAFDARAGGGTAGAGSAQGARR